MMNLARPLMPSEPRLPCLATFCLEMLFESRRKQEEEKMKVMGTGDGVGKVESSKDKG